MTMTVNGYTSTMFDPEQHDDYLVKTQEGCYDFAHFNIDGWSKGKNTDGTPFLWAKIPQTDEKYESVI